MLKIIKNTFPEYKNVPHAKKGDIVKIVKGDLVRISDNKIVFSKPKLLFAKPDDGIISTVKCRNEVLQVEPYFKNLPDVIISIQFSECQKGWNTTASVTENKEKKEAYLNYYGKHSRKGGELFFDREIKEHKSDIPENNALSFCEENGYSYCFS